MRIQRSFIVVLLAIFLILNGCTQKDESPADSTKLQLSEESNYGELPDKIGDNKDIEYSNIDVSLNDESEQWENIEYAKQTGEWFLAENGGNIGFSMTSGEKLPSSDVMISLQPHPENKVMLNRQVRAQLTKRDEDMNRIKLLKENIIDIRDIEDKALVLSAKLPDEEGIYYFLSVEILNEKQEPEDTLVTSIHVPKQEMNARMYSDNEEYKKDDKITLFIENSGSTTLFFGKNYTIEKKLDDQWRTVSLDRAFPEIGILLDPEGEPYSESISLERLDEGQYRVIKTIQVNGTDLKENLAVSFHIK